LHQLFCITREWRQAGFCDEQLDFVLVRPLANAKAGVVEIAAFAMHDDSSLDTKPSRDPSDGIIPN